MSKIVTIAHSVSYTEPNSSINLGLMAQASTLTCLDSPKTQHYRINAGATLSIKPTDMSADTEFDIVPTYVNGGADTNYGRYDVKVTHASGDSTFRARSGSRFSVLGTEKLVEIINPDATNALVVQVMTYKQA